MNDVGRQRLESAALIAAFLVVAAFVTSAVIGVARRPHAPVVVEAPAKALPTPPEKLLGRVEVLNATGRAGLARAASEQLRAAGYDVVYFGSRGSNAKTSVVLDRIGRPDIANGVAKALGITTVRSEKDTTLLLDASVIVGSDWQKKQVAQEEEQTGWKARIRKWVGR